MGKITRYSYIPQIYRDPKTEKVTEVYLPMVPIRVSYGYGKISSQFDALVDSGSDRNLFPALIATYLGIDLNSIRSKKVYGIGDNYIIAYPAKINIWIGKERYETEVDFSKKQQMPILGRNGFFNLFKSVKFDENGQFLYLEEK